MDRDDMDNVVHFVLTQYSFKQGLKKFQEAGKNAVKEEFLQLHQKETFKPIAPEELTSEQRKSALKLLVKQHKIYFKEEATSPTISWEAILLTSIIDAKEGRDVATTDILVAYLNTDMDNKVIMMME
eukprot:14405946-Ditylum_brightwellii.AAC.1